MQSTLTSFQESATPIPTQYVGPIRLNYQGNTEEVSLPLATYEQPLWPSVNRGARLTVHAGGLNAVVLDDRMTRSIVLEAVDATTAASCQLRIREQYAVWETAAATTSRFARLLDIHSQQVGGLLFLRLAFYTGDASGHNMATKAAEAVMVAMLHAFPELAHVSLSGNLCCDKKNSAVNGLLGRGKHVVLDATLPRKLVSRFLKTTPEAIVALNIKKNLIGSILSGGVRTANAHYANMLLAFYLATGQDAANIVEGSQGITHAEARDGNLYFSVTLPNIIVGTVGNGKGLPVVMEHLRTIGCLEERAPGENARRLAVLAGATVWCGELSLLAALTRPGELVDAHMRLERKSTPSPTTPESAQT